MSFVYLEIQNLVKINHSLLCNSTLHIILLIYISKFIKNNLDQYNNNEHNFLISTLKLINTTQVKYIFIIRHFRITQVKYIRKYIFIISHFRKMLSNTSIFFFFSFLIFSLFVTNIPHC